VDALLDRLEVERALDRLSPRDRRLLHLRYACDMTHPAVAASTGMSVSNVKVRLHRLRAKLEQNLSP
jgi:RNA polymerase sigma-70 factor, ECF subfamily